LSASCTSSTHLSSAPKPSNAQAKKTKAVAQRLAKALHGLKTVLASPDLGLPVHGVFSLDEVEYWRKEALAASQMSFVTSGQTNDAKRFAAQAAARLLSEYGLELKVAPKSKLCRLAACLFGDESAHMVRACRAEKNYPNRA
jgi:hypothetical protein